MNSSTQSAARRNLQRLNVIRSIAIGGQFIALYYFGYVDDIGLPVVTLTWILCLYGAVLLLSGWRSHWRQPITEPEFFAHLLVDILFFSFLLYFSGGANNPFISYYLVPISIAAATLPWRYTWATTLLSLIAYSLLLFNHMPIDQLSPSHGHHHGGHSDNGILNLHLIGMWATFVISAGLITYFVVKMATELRQQEALLNERRETELRNNQVVAVATLAAGTAHELGTPLNTMQILLDEMAELPQSDDNASDITTLQQQVSQCRKTLQQLVAAAELSGDEHADPQPIRSYFCELFERWEVMRPTAKATFITDADAPDIAVSFPPTVAQSLHNLMNNAADASEQVKIDLTWNEQQIELTIRDFGSGVSPELIEKLGSAFITTKPGGLGLGLFLTHTSLNRIGGRVSMENASDGGAITKVLLPVRPPVQSSAKEAAQ